MSLDAELMSVLQFLRKYPNVRSRLCAPPDKTVVYSGGIERAGEVFRAWEMLAKAKLQDPRRFDYMTLEERLRQFHVVQFGETLFEYATRTAASLQRRGLPDQAAILWRALSGIYIQGAVGRVRALILPDMKTSKSVFGLTEVNVLLRQDVLQSIRLDPELLRQFKVQVRSGAAPTPIVVF
jgi:hypothetical protein